MKYKTLSFVECWRKLLQDHLTDLCSGDWCVDGQDIIIWEDTSSLATGVVIENGGSIAEDVN